MDIFANVKSMRHTNAHGEINLYKIEEGAVDTSGFTKFTDTSKSGDFIVGHSETGHNHVLEREGVTMLEKDHSGIKILYAILESPVKLYQEAASPHEAQIIQPGAYIIGASLDYNPFTQQAKRVAD